MYCVNHQNSVYGTRHGSLMTGCRGHCEQLDDNLHTCTVSETPSVSVIYGPANVAICVVQVRVSKIRPGGQNWPGEDLINGCG